MTSGPRPPALPAALAAALLTGAGALAATALAPGISRAANCDVTSVGFTPIDDLGPGAYEGETGGLYPDGARERPAAHDAAGRALAESITPIDGLIVLISIGMSNTTQEFSRFVPLAMEHPGRNPALLVVDCAAGGQHAAIAADPDSPYWNLVRQRLAQAGADSSQVRAAWVKEAVPGPDLPFPDDAHELGGYLRAIAMNLTDKFPNLAIAYFSSRIYAGYASTPLNPEPWAYQSSFAVKWMIEDQIDGSDPGLNYDPDAGPIEAPWLAWGPYLWADGLVPRSDGLTWACSDFANDGTHPSLAGANKVAHLLLDFFTSDATATPWFLAAGTGAGEDAGTAPGARLVLLPARPNPAAGGARIGIAAGEGGMAAALVAVYDLAGRLVRVLHRGRLAPGAVDLVWDGADQRGRPAPAGTYFVRATAAGGASAVKVVLAR